ncbi:MMPL family transporter [Cryptosporangium arvum]|uniref:Putative RND superfamily drug exporter n=1 Tax=Cryptosporangium arvum DSM 44712 TaxID=927661 RepID=A0A010Z5V5_9ACTN|nr:MMPL family transporter [Cryptosporangium arvum]EXG82708.1 putative RND superfamily drug exporter [Cryptosporangium arvum DSM 44712]
MESVLYRLGRACFRRRRLTLAVWAAVLVVLGVGAATLSGPTDDAVSLPGTESWRALDVVDEEFGESTSARVVFTAPGGAALTGPDRQSAVRAAVAALRDAPQVAEVSDPYQAGTVAPDGRTAYATVTYPGPATDVGADSRAALREAGDTARRAGLDVEYAGEVTETEEASSGTELLGLAVAAVILLVTFRSVVAAGLPLLTAIVGVVAGTLGISIATGFLDLPSNTAALATMLGLAVGIDYALFLLSRYRHELAAGRDGEEAAGRAVGSAGTAVVFAGLTVVIALAALAVVGIPLLAAMGVAAAGTVAVAVVLSLTLLPALFGVAGRRIGPRAGAGGRGERWTRSVVGHRVVASLGCAVVVGLLAVPALDLRTALPDAGSAPAGSTQRAAYDQLAAAFGPGVNGPLLVVVQGADVAAPSARAHRFVAGLEGVVVATPPTANRAGDTAMFSVVPATAPTSDATRDLVHAIRADRAGLSAASGGATLAVTGRTAIDIDVSEKVNRALRPYLAIVLGLAFVLLTVMLRSILIPIKAVLGFLMSVAASFGALVLVFPSPLDSFLPIFLVGVLFGLAMDYEVFLVTRVREEHLRGAPPDDAVVTGTGYSARVVTAAALIMISIFASFVPSDDGIIRTLGFGLAVGVAVDALLIRMTLGPAVLSLFGRAVWWLPQWLARFLPNGGVRHL